MRSILLILLSTIIFSACEKMELDNPENQRDIDHRAWLEYYSLGRDLELNYYATLKYQMMDIQENPNLSFQIDGVTGSNAYFAGETLNIHNDFASSFFISSDYDQLKDSLNFRIDSYSYQFPFIEPIRVSANQTDVLNVGEEILWNEPTSGPDKIIIWIKRDNLLVSDSVRQIPSPRKHIYTDDDGVYTLRDEDLSGFPPETPLILTLVRGDFTIDSTGFFIGTVSLCYDFVTMK